MSLISFDKVLKIIGTILNILSYAIGLLSGGKVEPQEEEE